MNAKQKFIANIKDNIARVLSAPSRAYQDIRGSRFDSARSVLKQAQAYDNAPNRNDDGSITDAAKVRFMADEVRRRYKK